MMGNVLSESSPSSSTQRGGRASEVRWRASAKKICRQLGRYCVADVKRELRNKARVGDRRAANNGRSNLNVGFCIPTTRQIEQFLVRAEWSVVEEPGGPHRQTVYRFEEGDH